MKKLLLFLLIINQQICSLKNYELKVYGKINKLTLLAAVTTGIISIGWLKLVGSSYKYDIDRKGLEKATIQEMIKCSIPGFAGLIGSSLVLKSFYKWHNKPILIFDEEGFTYAKPKGLFKDREYVRYLWRNVISHWVTGVVDIWKRPLKKTWCYHIKGEKDILKINALELDIPKNLQAKVESLRMGNIRALWN